MSVDGSTVYLSRRTIRRYIVESPEYARSARSGIRSVGAGLAAIWQIEWLRRLA